MAKRGEGRFSNAYVNSILKLLVKLPAHRAGFTDRRGFPASAKMLAGQECPAYRNLTCSIHPRPQGGGFCSIVVSNIPVSLERLFFHRGHFDGDVTPSTTLGAGIKTTRGVKHHLVRVPAIHHVFKKGIH